MAGRWPRLSNKALGELRIQLGMRLREARKSRKMTQWQVADRLEWSRSSVAMMERGLQAVTVDQLHNLASLFETDVKLFLCSGPVLFLPAAELRRFQG